jgi:metallo-beta-lactamase family protein
MDKDTQRLLANREDPFAIPNLHYSLTTEESIAINNLDGPAVVISASGMADAGRIKHHLRHNLWREGASVVFVGFQADGTTGRKIIDGAQKVRILNEDVAVKAKIYTINGFSAHAGQSQILQWLSHFEKKTMEVILVHGEYAAQQVLADRIKERFGMKILIPDYLEEVVLKPDVEPVRVAYPERAPAGIDWDDLLDDLEVIVARLRSQKADLEAKGAAQQDEIRNRLLEAGRGLSDIISES